MNVIYKENNPSITAKEFSNRKEERISFPPPHRMTVVYIKLAVSGVEEISVGPPAFMGVKSGYDIRKGLTLVVISQTGHTAYSCL